MRKSFFQRDFFGLWGRRPQAIAMIKGSEEYSGISGTVRFYSTHLGVLVIADVGGLPGGSGCEERIFGFHIHEGESCSGNGADPFANTLSHYDTHDCPHPYHAGDLPPLFSAGGYAFSAFLSDRFSIEEIVGKTVVIHDSPDDFTTQPSGNAGRKIACGEILG